MVNRTSYSELFRRRVDRRNFLVGVSALAAPLTFPGAIRAGLLARAPGFSPVPPNTDNMVRVPEGYTADVLLRWGDPLFENVGPFDRTNQTAERQRRQFGTSADFTTFLPIGRDGKQGILCVNHESASAKWMFPGCDPSNLTSEQVETQKAAIGMSLVVVDRDDNGRWTSRESHRANRRIHAETEMLLTGPAAGSPLLQTKVDPSGTRVRGMLGNCGGGQTPWGSVLTCEENVDEYFANAGAVEDKRLREDFLQLLVKETGSVYDWARSDARFDLANEPHELHRFGWVVEIDPFAPESTPRKLTALGRFKHEAATCGLTQDMRVVVYMGDDQEGECLYKFVTTQAMSSRSRSANAGLLDDGVLYVAQFNEDGTGRWLPLVPEGILEDWTAAEIAVRTRAAAELVGGTPMDRPEGLQLHPLTQRLFVALTNNNKRTASGPANSRFPNRHGHVLEVSEAHGDLSALQFTWDPFLVAGPADADGSFYGSHGMTKDEALSCPDNLLFDSHGQLWIATDGQPKTLKTHDALYCVPTMGMERAHPRRFLTAPTGAEVTGPTLTPDERTLFLSIQHPGGKSGPTASSGHWPEDDVARSSVVAVRSNDGSTIGG